MTVYKEKNDEEIERIVCYNRTKLHDFIVSSQGMKSINTKDFFDHNIQMKRNLMRKSKKYIHMNDNVC